MTPYYEHGGITIYHGDCREVLPLDCGVVITDPPYSTQTHEGARTGEGDVALVDFADIDPAQLREVLAMCNPQRWTVATMDWKHIAEMERHPPSGLRFVRFGIWIKPERLTAVYRGPPRDGLGGRGNSSSRRRSHAVGWRWASRRLEV